MYLHLVTLLSLISLSYKIVDRGYFVELSLPRKCIGDR